MPYACSALSSADLSTGKNQHRIINLQTKMAEMRGSMRDLRNGQGEGAQAPTQPPASPRFPSLWPQGTLMHTQSDWQGGGGKNTICWILCLGCVFS